MIQVLEAVSRATCKQGLQVQGIYPQFVCLCMADAEDVAALEQMERKLGNKGWGKKK